MRNQQLGDAWQLLPAEYRNDVSGLAAALSQKVDPEVYGQGVSTLTGIVGLLRDKNGIIADLAKQQMGPMGNSLNVSAAIQSITAVLGALTESKHLQSTEALGNIDLEAFAQDAGRALIPAMIDIAKAADDDQSKQMLAFFDGEQDIEVREVSSGGDHAVLELAFGDETVEVHMAKVGQQWLPEQLAHGWQGYVSSAMQAVQAMPTMTDQNKAQAAGVMAMVDQLVGQLSECESGEEMMETAMRNPLIAMMKAAMGGR